jgi:hypothetical protein
MGRIRKPLIFQKKEEGEVKRLQVEINELKVQKSLISSIYREISNIPVSTTGNGATLISTVALIQRPRFKKI